MVISEKQLKGGSFSQTHVFGRRFTSSKVETFGSPRKEKARQGQGAGAGAGAGAYDFALAMEQIWT